MFCSNCGSEIREGTAFCPNCGNQIINNAVKAEEPEAAVEDTSMEVPAEEVLEAIPVKEEIKTEAGTVKEAEPVRYSGHSAVAIIGFVLAIIGVCFCWTVAGIFLCIAGIVLGAVGIYQANKNKSKKGLAVAALVLGIVFLIVSVIIVSVLALLIATFSGSFREAPAPPDYYAEQVENRPGFAEEEFTEIIY